MRSFRISENIEIVCRSESTRSGFRHLATLLRDGREVGSAKCCYQNRTWERYEFQSVLKKIVDQSEDLSEEEKKLCTEYIDGDQTDWTAFKTTGMAALMGDLLCDTQKEKNDWKARMLKAGLGNAGLTMPEDWDELDENTKQARLDKVLKVVGEVSNDK